MLGGVPEAGRADEPRRDGGPALIDELVREGAPRMLAEALQAEVDDYVAYHTHASDEHDWRLVVAAARISPGRCSSRSGRCKWGPRGSTTAARTR